MTDLSESNITPPKWPTFLTVILLAAGGLLGVLVLLNNAGAADLDPKTLINAARVLAVGCGAAAALIYTLVRKQHRARAALLGNLILVAGLMALGALQILEKGGEADPARNGLHIQKSGESL